MRQNIGTINALIRITIGFVLLSCSIAKLVRKPWCVWSKILLWFGAMKIAEGIIRFCPMVAACKFGKFMNISGFKMPSMDLTQKGHAKEEGTHTSSLNKTETKGSYDASDKEIESAIERAIMTKPL